MNKLGFGFLRLPFQNGVLDETAVCQMTDAFLSGGGQYFDTAYTYLNGQSEAAVRRCLVQRYPRESFLLADKLPGYLAQTTQDSERYFTEQLRRCGVDYFDVYLLHWMTAAHYAKAEALDQFSFLQRLKEEGLVRKTGFSFHDTAEQLDLILTRHPEVDYVQLQINYLDWDSPSIQSRLCYETARRHGKQVLVMEPIKGGTLAKLPHEAEALLKPFRGSASMQALQFVQSLPGTSVVLSGMSSLAQVRENLSVETVITEEHRSALFHAAEILARSIAVPCTGCGYCLEHCPQGIAIPAYFALYNECCRFPEENWKIHSAFEQLAARHGTPEQCIGCRSCEKACPQKLPVTVFLKQAAAALNSK